jgi:DNA-binding MarR family transcriptional regulator
MTMTRTANALPGHTPAGAAFTEGVLEVFRLNGELLAAGDRLAARLGLTSARWQVMGAVSEGPLTAAQIGRRMGLARQSIHRTVGLLAGEGLVRLVPNPDHRAADLIQLTQRGEKSFAAISRLQERWANQCARSLSAAALRDCLRTLQAMRAALDSKRGRSAQ